MFCCGKMTTLAASSLKNISPLQTVEEVHRDLKIRDPLNFTEKRLDLVGHNTSDFEGIRPSLSGAIIAPQHT